MLYIFLVGLLVISAKQSNCDRIMYRKPVTRPQGYFANNPRLIWYQDGHNSPADTVHIPPNSDITKFYDFQQSPYSNYLPNGYFMSHYLNTYGMNPLVTPNTYPSKIYPEAVYDTQYTDPNVQSKFVAEKLVGYPDKKLNSKEKQPIIKETIYSPNYPIYMKGSNEGTSIMNYKTYHSSNGMNPSEKQSGIEESQDESYSHDESTETQTDHEHDSYDEDQNEKEGDYEEENVQKDDYSDDDDETDAKLLHVEPKASTAHHTNKNNEKYYSEEKKASQDSNSHSTKGYKTVEGTKTRDEYSKGDKEKYKEKSKEKEYSEEGQKKKEFVDEKENHGSYKEAKESSKGGQFKEKKKHKKGSKTTGYHNVYHKDEYVKDHIFYDQLDHKGSFKNAEKVKKGHQNESSNHKKGEYQDSAYKKQEESDKGKYKKGHNDNQQKGYEEKSQNDENEKHQEVYSNKGEKENHREKAYQEKKP